MNAVRSMASFAALTLIIGQFGFSTVSAAVEPTSIDERYYTSGRAERHQKTSPTLPVGSPIPDSASFTPTSTTSHPVSTSQTAAPAEKKADTTSDASDESFMTPTGDKRKLAGKVDPTLKMRLDTEIRNETNKFKLKLTMSECSPEAIKQLKELRHLRVVTVDDKENEIVIEAPAKLLEQIVEIPQVKFVSRN